MRLVLPRRVDPASGNSEDVARKARSRALAAVRELTARGFEPPAFVEAIKEAGGVGKLAAAHAARGKGDPRELLPSLPKIAWRWADTAVATLLKISEAGSSRFSLEVNVVAAHPGRLEVEVLAVVNSPISQTPAPAEAEGRA
jgi:hypothetical protein